MALRGPSGGHTHSISDLRANADDVGKSFVVQSDGTIAAAPSGGLGAAHIRYVAVSGGDDSTAVLGDPSQPYATISAALDDAVAGEVVLCLAGTHAQAGGQLTIPNGVALVGEGAHCTTVSFSGTLAAAAGATCIGWASGANTAANAVRVADLTISMALSGVTISIPLGVYGASITDYPDCCVERVRILGKADTLYIQNGNARIFAKDCYFESEWDLFYCNTGVGGSNTPNEARMEFEGCTFLFKPEHDNAALTAGTRTSAQLLNRCTVIMRGANNWIINGAGLNTALAENKIGGILLNSVTAKLVLGSGFCVDNRGGFVGWPPEFSIAGTPAHPGDIVLTGAPLADLSNYSGTNANLNTNPLRLVPLTPVWVECNIRAAAAGSTEKETWRLTAEALTETFAICSLPPGAIVEACILEVRSAAGGATTVTVECGITGATTDYLAATNVKATGWTKGAGAGLGTIEATGDPTNGADVNVEAVVTTTVENVDDVTDLDCFVRVLVSGGAPRFPRIEA